MTMFRVYVNLPQLWPFINNWLLQWDYTIYKWAFVSTYNWYIKGHNWEIFSWDIRDDATVPCRHEAWRPVNCLPAKACNVLGVCTFNGLV